MVRNCAAAVLLIFMVAGAGASDDSKATPPQTTTPSAVAARKSDLRTSVRVSTSDALSAAAHAKARKDVADKPDSSSDVVLEFHPATGTPDGTSNAVVTKDANKSALKNLHGDLYGNDGTSGHELSGRAGTKSKNGKTAIYVESNHSTSSPLK